MKPLVTRHVLAVSLAAIVGLLGAGHAAQAQSTSGTIFGTGWDLTPSPTLEVRDTNWKIVAYPTGFTPPGGQSAPYDSYVPYNTWPSFVGGTPQSGIQYLGGTNYWIAPQASVASLLPGNVTYNWIAQQQFSVPVSGFYKFNFPGAGDNELEFYIDGSIDTSDAMRPTITGGQQIGGRAGTFNAMTQFTGGAQLASGTHTASMVLWDYGGLTGALIGSSTFAPSVAYWATGSAAGGNGTWNNTNADWTSDVAGVTTKQPWTNSAGYAFFGGVSGTVTVGENVTLTKAFFTTGGYQVTGGSTLVYGAGAEIIVSSGTATIAAPQNVSSRLKISGNATTRLTGNTVYGFGGITEVSNGTLLVDGYVGSPVTVTSSGKLGGSGRIDGTISGAGQVSPGNSPGILSATAINPSGGLDFTFEFSGTIPTFGSPTSSVNDLIRLTGATPFTSAMTGSNTKMLFLNMTEAQLTPGTILKGGFFTDVNTDFVSMLNNQPWNNGGFLVYVLGDGAGTDSALNGQGYYNWRTLFGWDQSLFLSTEAQTANFGSGNVDGRIMVLAIGVPEPSTYAMGLAGAGFLGLAQWSRRRRRPRSRRSA